MNSRESDRNSSKTNPVVGGTGESLPSQSADDCESLNPPSVHDDMTIEPGFRSNLDSTIEPLCSPGVGISPPPEMKDAASFAGAGHAIDSPSKTAPFESQSPTYRDFTLEDFNLTESGARQFGDYLLIEEIARGGMGVVYKAIQRKLRRTVALKMILAGELATSSAVQRFHVEAEAAARLDHPGIVPIYEVGDVDGQHYFSMGYVDGGSLAGKLAAGPLTPVDAARYVRKIADAVAYAHAHGVIHRDLKPSNVLLDSTGEPKISDFGVAKQVDSGEGSSGSTATGEILGTPSYMPPEQAGGRVGQVGPVSDVYSIGAILYSLVTGRPPFQAAAVVDTLMQVLEKEVVPPRQLNDGVPKDLQTICLKCLRKEPARRYQSAGELRDEIDRFLNGVPIVARPVGRAERLARWCRRKPALAGMSATLLVVSAVGIAAVFVFWRRAERNLVEASEQRTIAERRLRDTQEIVNRYFTEVSENVLLNKPGMQDLRNQLYRRALEYYQRFVEEEKQNPALQMELANAYVRLASINDTLMSTERRSEQLFEQATQIYERFLAQTPDDVPLRRRMASAYNQLAVQQDLAQGTDKGKATFDRALELSKQLIAQPDHPVDDDILYARIAGNLALWQQLRGERVEAKRNMLQIIESQKALLKRPLDPKIRSRVQSQLASIYINLAAICEATREGVTFNERAAELLEPLCAANPSDMRLANNLGHVYYNNGATLGMLGDHVAAERSVLKSNAIVERLIVEHPTLGEYRWDIVRNYTELSRIAGAAGRKPQAIAYMETGLKTLDLMMLEQPDELRHRVAMVERLVMLGRLFVEQKLDNRARSTFERASGLSDELMHRPDDPGFVAMRIAALSALAEFRRTHGSTEEAIGLADDALKQFRRLVKLPIAVSGNLFDIDGTIDVLAKVELVLNGRPNAVELLTLAGEFSQQLAGDRKLAVHHYNAACYFARAASTLKGDSNLTANPDKLDSTKGSPLPSQAAILEKYHQLVARSLDQLQKAVQSGYNDINHIKSDPDLVPLRQLPAFRRLLGDSFKSP